MTAAQTGPQGGHPHSDRRNWSTATTPAEYLANCREGLEAYSERRFAKLLGWPRIMLWRSRMLASIPEALFELLLKARIPERELAKIGQLISEGKLKHETEYCPHCGEALRARIGISETAIGIVTKYLAGEIRP
jgi:hypothetical protein